MKKFAGLSVMAAVAFLGLASASRAEAGIYLVTCTSSACNGTLLATITMADGYVEGTAMNASNFVSVTYSGYVTPAFTTTATPPVGISGFLKSGSGLSAIDIYNGTTGKQFALSSPVPNPTTGFTGNPPAAAWCAGTYCGGASGGDYLLSTDSAVPEPGTTATMLTGALGLSGGLWWRRRRQQRA